MPAPVPSVSARLGNVASSPVRDILALTARPGVISFAGGLPAPELFDAEGLRGAYDRVLSRDPRRVLQYSTTEGDPSLRSAIAERASGRGLPTSADQLLVTSGSQQALTLVATALVEPGDVVLVEEPTYLAALQCFSLAGARVVPVPSDDRGLDPEALARLAGSTRARLLYLVPTFQNPTGRTLPAERRRAIAEVAAECGLWIVEDNPYEELRFRGEPLPPLAAFTAAADRTIGLGSLSKIMAPGMRIGWVRAPEWLRRSLVIAKQAADLHTSTVDQAAAAEYLNTVDIEAHLVRVRAAYLARRDAMLDALPSCLPAGSTWTDPDGGMFVWARLPDGHDATALLRRALDHDVAFVPGAPFFVEDPDPATLRLSYTAHPPAEITEGIHRLSAAITR